jgi:DNA-binding Xre family transcriptional regulator
MDGHMVMLAVREDLLVQLFIAAGAISYENLGKMNDPIVKNEFDYEVDAFSAENQIVSHDLPQSILEVVKAGKENRLRAIMFAKGLSLKEVAERYGGKSAASNVANFLQKKDEDVRIMRQSTLQRLATALDCPIDWLLQSLPTP